jgi:hypothetical protein
MLKLMPTNDSGGFSRIASGCSRIRAWIGAQQIGKDVTPEVLAPMKKDLGLRKDTQGS